MIHAFSLSDQSVLNLAIYLSIYSFDVLLDNEWENADIDLEALKLEKTADSRSGPELATTLNLA